MYLTHVKIENILFLQAHYQKYVRSELMNSSDSSQRSEPTMITYAFFLPLCSQNQMLGKIATKDLEFFAYLICF